MIQYAVASFQKNKIWRPLSTSPQLPSPKLYYTWRHDKQSVSSKNYYYYKRFMTICPGLPEWVGTRRNIHSLTPILIISHPLSCIFHYLLWSYPFNLRVWQSVCTTSIQVLSFILVWHLPLHTPYISSPNHCLLFARHANTTTTCFAVEPRLCHLILISLNSLLGILP